jgi:hypothetical protein
MISKIGVFAKASAGFYGWYALAGVMLINVVSGGVSLFSFGVFLPVMCAKLEWSRAVSITPLPISLSVTRVVPLKRNRHSPP